MNSAAACGHVKTSFALSMRLSESPDAVLEVTQLQQKFRYALDGFGTLELLDRARDWTPIEELERELVREQGLDPASADALLDQLLQMGLLVRSGNATGEAVEKAADLWSRHGWSVPLQYHLLVHDYPFLDYASEEDRQTDVSWMHEYKAADGEPPLYKEYPERERVALPRASLVQQGGLAEIFAQTVPTGTGPLSLDAFSALMYLSFGRVGVKLTTATKPRYRRTSPSGGARHPTEVYVAPLQVEGLRPGIYHYGVEHHALERLGGADPDALVRTVCAGWDSDVEPVAICFFSSLFYRNAWRYREPRTFRVLFLDLGHILQTTELVAGALGLRFQAEDRRIDDEALESLLGLDGFSEGVLCAAVLGR